MKHDLALCAMYYASEHCEIPAINDALLHVVRSASQVRGSRRTQVGGGVLDLTSGVPVLDGGAGRDARRQTNPQLVTHCCRNCREIRVANAWRLPSTSCSQTRMTLQPRRRKSLVTLLSRSTFLPIFPCQNSMFVFGRQKCLLQRCQKHPSTNTATFCFTNRRSGRPTIFA